MIVNNFIIKTGTSAREALRKLDQLSMSGSVLFVVDEKNRILGSLTDGDIRRGLLKDLVIDDVVDVYMRKNFRHLVEGSYTKMDIKKMKDFKIRFCPLIDKNQNLLKIMDIQSIKSFLPIDAVLMAGGKGERLLPLTLETPKPLLKIGDLPIIEHNINRLIQFGINNITISLRYLGSKISDYFGDGSSRGVNIRYVTEDTPRGTMGALSLIESFQHDCILVMNSDLLTNIDFEAFYEKFIEREADMIVATTPYHVSIPFAIFELDEGSLVTKFMEKPKYTYHSNAGIYLMKEKLLKLIPPNIKFDATDMMDKVIEKKLKFISDPILGYWLDIGSMQDFKKAQEDIKHINL